MVVSVGWLQPDNLPSRITSAQRVGTGEFAGESLKTEIPAAPNDHRKPRHMGASRDVDIWVASASPGGALRLVPLSFDNVDSTVAGMVPTMVR